MEHKMQLSGARDTEIHVSIPAWTHFVTKYVSRSDLSSDVTAAWQTTANVAKMETLITAQHLTRDTASRNWNVSCCGYIVSLPILPFAIPHHLHMYWSSWHYQENQSGCNMYERNTNWFDHLQKTADNWGSSSKLNNKLDLPTLLYKRGAFFF